MKVNIFGFGILLSVITMASCGSSSDFVSAPIQMDTLITHDSVMRQKFKNKLQVITEYGVATRNVSYKDIEVWYYLLGESTNSQSQTINSEKGKITQNPWNLVLPPIAQSVNTTKNSTSSGITYSYSTNSYVQFWFKNDSVIKYDSKGVNYAVVKPRKPVNGESQYSQEYQKAELTWYIPVIILSVPIIYYLATRSSESSE
jgi:hypothetical protein